MTTNVDECIGGLKFILESQIKEKEAECLKRVNVPGIINHEF